MSLSYECGVHPDECISATRCGHCADLTLSRVDDVLTCIHDGRTKFTRLFA